MISTEEKKQIIDDIVNGPDFKESQRYQELLQYLIKETEAGNSLKELTIGINFFDRGSRFDPKEDTTVRVYMNTLRKKLEHHYLTVPNKYQYKLVIPRGHYQVEYEEIKQEVKPELKPEGTSENIQDSNFQPPVSKGFSNLAVIIISTVCLLAGIIITFILIKIQPVNPEAKPSTLWKEYLNPGGRPTLVVLGDFTFLYERQSGGGTNSKFIRDMRINSAEDYKQLVKNDPEFAARYILSEFTFLRPSASWGLSSIIPILEKLPKGYTIKLSSQFTLDDLKSNNVVFIGSFKSLHNVQKILQVFKLSYLLSPPQFSIAGKDSVKKFLSQNVKGGNYEKDYAVVAKGVGPEESNVMLLLGFADTGTIEACKFAGNPESFASQVPELMTRLNSAFTLVIETEGINQSIFKTHIQYYSHE